MVFMFVIVEVCFVFRVRLFDFVLLVEVLVVCWGVGVEGVVVLLERVEVGVGVVGGVGVGVIGWVGVVGGVVDEDWVGVGFFLGWKKG